VRFAVGKGGAPARTADDEAQDGDGDQTARDHDPYRVFPAGLVRRLMVDLIYQ